MQSVSSAALIAVTLVEILDAGLLHSQAVSTAFPAGPMGGGVLRGSRVAADVFRHHELIEAPLARSLTLDIALRRKGQAVTVGSSADGGARCEIRTIRHAAPSGGGRECH
jgi:hypothetical protein